MSQPASQPALGWGWEDSAGPGCAARVVSWSAVFSALRVEPAAMLPPSGQRRALTRSSEFTMRSQRWPDTSNFSPPVAPQLSKQLTYLRTTDKQDGKLPSILTSTTVVLWIVHHPLLHSAGSFCNHTCVVCIFTTSQLSQMLQFLFRLIYGVGAVNLV